MVGPDWVTRFIKHNLYIFIRKQKPLAAERKEAYGEDTLRAHFERFKSVVKDKGVKIQDLYNMDETGFRIGCGVAYSVITIEAKKALILTDPSNRNYITSIECISARADR